MFTIVFLMLFTAEITLKSQDQPKPKKDTVNMDTNAKPTFYYADEDVKTKNNTATTVIIAGAAIVVIAGVVLLFRRKK